MKIWITKSGKEIPYDELDTDHIYNIIKYAETHGFYSQTVSKSTVDNTDDVVILKNISKEVIADMKDELARRGGFYVYYVECLDVNKKWIRVSPMFYYREKVSEWIKNIPNITDDYNIVKERVI